MGNNPGCSESVRMSPAEAPPVATGQVGNQRTGGKAHGDRSGFEERSTEHDSKGEVSAAFGGEKSEQASLRSILHIGSAVMERLHVGRRFNGPTEETKLRVVCQVQVVLVKIIFNINLADFLAGFCRLKDSVSKLRQPLWYIKSAIISFLGEAGCRHEVHNFGSVEVYTRLTMYVQCPFLC